MISFTVPTVPCLTSPAKLVINFAFSPMVNGLLLMLLDPGENLLPSFVRFKTRLAIGVCFLLSDELA